MGPFNRVTDTHWLNKKPRRIAWKKLIDDFVRSILDFIIYVIGLAFPSLPTHPHTTEFPHLQGYTYLDYAGSPPYSAKLVQDAANILLQQPYTNPHSEATGGGPSSTAISTLRQLTLDMLNVNNNEYECILTSGATSALKLVGEMMQSININNNNNNEEEEEEEEEEEITSTINAVNVDNKQQGDPPTSSSSSSSPSCCFLYLKDNHTSVIGIREQIHAAIPYSFTSSVEITSYDGKCDSDKEGKGERRLCLKLESDTTNNDSSNNSSSSIDMIRRESSPIQASLSSKYHLFAMPAESNFNGVRYDVSLLNTVHSHPENVEITVCTSSIDSDNNVDKTTTTLQELGGGGGQWLTLLDAAKACNTSPPDLSSHQVDFCVLSYYKIFGHPTGLGALVVRKCLLEKLYSLENPALDKEEESNNTMITAEAAAAVKNNERKGPRRGRYFGGGTLSFITTATAAAAQDNNNDSGNDDNNATSSSITSVRRQGAAGYEDGTLPYQQVPATIKGFEFMQRIHGWTSAAERAEYLASKLRLALASTRHYNHAPIAILYHPSNNNNASSSSYILGQGPVVTFNLLRSTGDYIGYRHVDNLASMHNIKLRTGCLCNPGACATALGYTSQELRRNFLVKGHTCFTSDSDGDGGGRDIIDGRPTGLIRVSLGYASTENDVEQLLAFIYRYFVEEKKKEERNDAATSSSSIIMSLWVYPIKSCGGFSPQQWPIHKNGLIYDRCWALVKVEEEEEKNGWYISSFAPLTLRTCSHLTRIHPMIDLNNQVMIIKAAAGGSFKEEEEDCLVVPLVQDVLDDNSTNSTELLRKEEQKRKEREWFYKVLGIHCQLVMADDINIIQQKKKKKKNRETFQNNAPLLAVGKSDLVHLWRESRYVEVEGLHTFTQRFRPNIIVDSLPLLSLNGEKGTKEEERKGVVILKSTQSLDLYSTTVNSSGTTLREEDDDGDNRVVVKLCIKQRCTRCERICTSPTNGETEERGGGLGLLKMLAEQGKERGQGGVADFGVLLEVDMKEKEEGGVVVVKSGMVVKMGRGNVLYILH